VRALVLFLAALLLGASLSAQPKTPVWDQTHIRKYFHAYVGKWVGEWTITDVEGVVVKRITLQQQYWWDKGHLKGLMSFEDRGRLSSLTSDIYLQRGEIISEVVNTEERNFYRAHPDHNHILWTPMKSEDVLRRRIKEYIVQKEGVTWFISEGFERLIDDEEKTKVLLFKVELKKVS